MFWRVAVTLRDVALREAEDEVIWNYAQQNDLIILTKDEDFANRVWRSSEGPAVVWLRMGNCSNQVLTERLVALLEIIITRIESGDRLVEVN